MNENMETMEQELTNEELMELEERKQKKRKFIKVGGILGALVGVALVVSKWVRRDNDVIDADYEEIEDETEEPSEETQEQ